MKRGDVVLATFPHAGPVPKIRPVVVIQSDFYNQRIANVLLASITSNLTRINDPAHLFIDVSTPDGKLSGLTKNSLVSCLNLAVLPKSDIGPTIGRIGDPAMKQLDQCLLAALGIH